MKGYFIKGAAIMGVAGLMVMPLMGLAQTNQVQPLPSPTGYYSVGGFLGLITRALNYAFTFLLALAVIFVLYAAFIYLTAGGDAEKVSRANRIILYAAIAIAIAVLARAVPILVTNFLGAPQVNNPV
jgi:hypothetical protein